jgi:nucleoside-diphosphate-sugar epimerase
MEKIFVTGAAGFIERNHLVDRLRAGGKTVGGRGNFFTGERAFVESAFKSPRSILVEGDTFDPPALSRATAGVDFVFPLAVKGSIKDGGSHPGKALEYASHPRFQIR